MQLDPVWIPILIFLIGLLFGSFFNVCIYRLPRDQQVVKGRSYCTRCKKMIPWYWNIPLVSFLFLGGKCGFCKKKISWIYPIIEFSTACLFLTCYAAFGLSYFFFFSVVFCSLLLLISVIDIQHRIIPDELSLGGSVLGFLFSFFHPELFWWQSLLGFLLGGGSFYFIAWIYEKMTGVDGLGGGDIKLLAMVGAWLGYAPLVLVVASGSILGSLYGVAVMLRYRQGSKTAIPYGPFLSAGALIAFLFERPFFEYLLPS